MSKSKRSFWGGLFSGEEKSNGATTAADRLKVIVTSEHRLTRRLTPDRIEKMKLEIVEVVNKHVSGVRLDDVEFTYHTEEKIEVLEMSINLPEQY